MIYGQPVTLGGGGKTTIGASYNADGTQNLIIKDDGSVIEIPDPNPVLLWTNASPTSNFGPQTVTIDLSSYDAVIIESRRSTSMAATSKAFINVGGIDNVVASNNPGTITSGYSIRGVTVNTTGVVFTTGYGGGANATYTIPTRIWGVKFTL